MVESYHLDAIEDQIVLPGFVKLPELVLDLVQRVFQGAQLVVGAGGLIAQLGQTSAQPILDFLDCIKF